MKHLKILEQAQLFNTRWVGRCKHHYLKFECYAKSGNRRLLDLAIYCAHGKGLKGLIDLHDSIEQDIKRKEA